MSEEETCLAASLANTKTLIKFVSPFGEKSLRQKKPRAPAVNELVARKRECQERAFGHAGISFPRENKAK